MKFKMRLKLVRAHYEYLEDAEEITNLRQTQ